jgi:hypothetical protein
MTRGSKVASRVGLVPEAIRVAMRLPRVERWRSLGPQAATVLAREMGRRAPVRSPEDTARLRRAIGVVDRLCGANCYRRVLLELALDRKAADDPIYVGIRGRDDAGLGHAWRGHDARLEAQYEAVFRIS